MKKEQEKGKLTGNKTLAASGICATAFVSLVLAGCGGGSGTGTLVMSMQDAPVSNVEKLEVTISEVAVHFVPDKGGGVTDGGTDGETDGGEDDPAYTGGDPGKPGWRAIVSGEVTYDLLALKDNPAQLGLLELSPGKVTQIRLYISELTKPKVTIAGTQYDVDVPSSVVKIVGNFNIVAGEKLAIRLDFDAEASLVESSGSYSLKPTIKIVK